MRALRGIPTEATFEGPVFEGNIDVVFTNGFVAIDTNIDDENATVYNTTSIARLKTDFVE